VNGLGFENVTVRCGLMDARRGAENPPLTSDRPGRRLACWHPGEAHSTQCDPDGFVELPAGSAYADSSLLAVAAGSAEAVVAGRRVACRHAGEPLPLGREADELVESP